MPPIFLLVMEKQILFVKSPQFWQEIFDKSNKARYNGGLADICPPVKEFIPKGWIQYV